MNRKSFRVIFNAARGERMVVSEAARSCGKAGDTTTPGVLAALLLTIPLLAQAQIVADPSAPGTQRPIVLAAPNGVPVVNIQTPSAAGVSRNVYRQFDVQRDGVILNNSRTNASTQLGGWIAANPFLATGSARVILNEINSTNPSQLRGWVEVGGQRAEVVIANPAGIQVDGAGFINASGVTLTTGTPVMNAGNLESYRVTGGQVNIEGLGLDTRDADYTAILTRAMQVNAAIWAKELKVATGANEVRATAASTSGSAQATPIAGTGEKPTFALDVAALGGMYAGKIYLIGTEAGLGVNNAGQIASSGDLVLTNEGQLINRGLIDGGAVRLQAPEITNIGTGRIYGDQLALSAGVLTNDTETVNGVRSNATIAARDTLDIGAGQLANREHALIFSAGDIAIGGGLDAQGHAAGQASLITNASATIEALGSVSIDAAQLNNTNEHFASEVRQVGPVTTKTEYSLGAGDVAHGQDLVTHHAPSAVTIWSCETLCITVNATGDTSDAFVQYNYSSTPYETVVTRSDPARILAGGDMKLSGGDILNDRSEIVAGGLLDVQADSLTNTSVPGEKRVVHTGTATSFWRVRHSGGDGLGTATTGYNPADTVTVLELSPARAVGSAAVAGTGTQVAITDLPSLFAATRDPAAGYLIETDPRFASYRQWLGSDYLLASLSYDPATLHKRLGDGFYEQRLIREQVSQLTGQRFLDGYANDEAQYRALMEAGITHANDWKLVPGVALTAAQMAQLTSDIVWLVAEEVTLPDGTKTTALVPRVYVRAKEGDLAASGALLTGQSVRIDLAGDLVNSGTIAGRDVLLLDARNVQNMGAISAKAVDVAAREDLNVTGGRIVAQDYLAASAGRDLNVQSTTQDTGSGNFTRTGIDRVAGLYVTGEGGTLIASAGRDLNIVAGVLDSGGSIQASAGNNVNLATVTTSESTAVAWDSANWRKEGSTQEVGSLIRSGGSTVIAAGKDINARAAAVDAGGDLAAVAGRDVNITAGQDTRTTEEASRHKSKGTLSSRTLTTHDLINETQAVGSSLGGGTVTIVAGRDARVQGSSVVSDAGTAIAAQGNLTIEAAQDSYSRQSERIDKKSGVFSGGGLGVTAGKRVMETDQDSSSTYAAASTIGAIDGDVNLIAGQQYTQTGSDVLAPAGDINIAAQNVAITEARESSTARTEQRFKQSGVTLQITSPVISALQTVDSMAQAARNTDSRRMKALAGASSAASAYDAYEAVQAGGGTHIGGKANQVQSTNLDGTKTVRDANAADKIGGVNLSISLGSSSSRSTTTEISDTARGSRVAAGGDVNITSSGDGHASDILIQGSNISASNTVRLSADGDVNLLAAQNTASLSGSSSSKSGSIGVSIGTSGFGVTASASRGRGSEAGDDTWYSNTHVNAGSSVVIESGADTTLSGAVVSANQIQANVGGNLAIESLQDTSTYASKSSSVGGSITVGAGGGGSFNASKNKTNSEYASVNERSGIEAGDGGFQVNVGGNTSLTGGAIASTQAAVDGNLNSLETGTLSTSDLENHSSGSAMSSGFGVSTDMFTQGKYGLAKGAVGNALNNGSASGSASGTTRSAVSAGSVVITDEGGQTAATGRSGAETIATLNRDTANAHNPVQRQDVGAMQNEALAQQAIKNAAFAEAVKFSDEAYRVMFVEKTRMYVIERNEDGSFMRDADDKLVIRELSNEEKANLQPSSDNKVHIANNGIFNAEEAAAKYAVQHNTVGSGPQYLIYFPEANSTASELMVAGYQHFLEGDFLGNTNATKENREMMQIYGQSGLHLDGHSRGSMTVGNAMESLQNQPNSEGFLSGTTANFFGPAYNVQDADSTLGNLQNRSAADPQQQSGMVLQYQNHMADPVGALSGKNPGTGGTIPEGSSAAWEAIRAATGQPNTVHNCYGSSNERQCTQFWRDTGGFPAFAPAGEKGAKQ